MHTCEVMTTITIGDKANTTILPNLKYDLHTFYATWPVGLKQPLRKNVLPLLRLGKNQVQRHGCGSDHKAVLLAVMSHQDDIAIGGPDKTGELQVVLGARGSWLDRRNLVRLNAAELRGWIQHPDAAQQTGVHLERTGHTAIIGFSSQIFKMNLQLLYNKL